MLKSKNKQKVPESNQAAQVVWVKKKITLRWKMAILFVFINIVGLEFSAPGYSITTLFAENILSHSSFLPEIINVFQKLNSQFAFIDVTYQSFFGKSAKLLVLFMFASFCYYFICHKDPFNNLELLRQLPYKKYSRWHFYLRNIQFYASYLPSNILAEMCDKCSNNDECSRRISLTGEDKTSTLSHKF